MATYPKPEADPVAEADLAAHVAAADPHTQYQKETEKGQPAGYASLDGAGQVPTSQLGNAGATGDASTTVKGVTKLSVAPALASNPIAAGTNDPRLADARAPAGAAGGVLGGTYPNPAFAVDMATQAELDAETAARAAADALLAPLASPTFTGDPKAPTPAVDDNDTSIATTAYVIGQAMALADGTPAMDGAAARGISTHFARADHIHPSDTSRAPLASPTFTGDPKAPTPAQGDNDTSIATSAYVQTELGFYVPKSLVDAKGDLLVGTADNTVARKGVGANGAALVADSSQTDGLAWQSLVQSTITILGLVSKTNVNWNTPTLVTNHYLAFGNSSSGAQNASIAWDVLLAPGTWTMNLITRTGPDRGIYSMRLDGTEVGTIDGFAASGNQAILALAGVTVASLGTKSFSMVMATKNASSTSFFGDVSAVIFIKTA